MPYVIRNCPAYDYDEEFNHHMCKKPLIPYECSVDDCQDCTDCVMKCIKSKLDYLKCYINNNDSANLSKMNEIIDGTLQLLDIQEVE